MAFKASGAGYADVAAHFRTLIQNGELTPGDALPSVQEIREQFNVSAKTVSRSLAVLKSEGLATGRGSLGTVVSSRPRVASTGAARLDRLSRTGKHYAAGESSTDHVALLRSCADPDIAEQLGIDLHDEIAIRRRVFLQGGRPTVVALSCLHPRALAAVPELMQQGQLKPFWQTTYTERTGRTVTRSPERRGARLATNDELQALQVQAPPTAAVPVLVLHTTFHDEEGPLEVWEDVYAPGLWQVSGSV
ncbi:GntR family transcriptional regulator [Streptomyces sp. b62]|uniref:GntR family transcriptional regulator n=1 Tax=Streptomyces sp. b62 TaxID=1827627 RepID=UPI000BEFC9EF|nr:GntR family transcriptional regulator [Streptomyces sp. b62]